MFLSPIFPYMLKTERLVMKIFRFLDLLENDKNQPLIQEIKNLVYALIN